MKRIRSGQIIALTVAAMLIGVVAVRAQETRTYDGNWDVAPEAGDHIVIESGTLTWDASLPDTVGDWTQSGGTVTFDTRFPGQGAFEVFTINGDAEITGGTWTHTANPAGTNQVHRLRVHVTGDLTLGADALITGKGRGLLRGYGPGNSNNDNIGATHGGIGGGSLVVPYGSVLHPQDLGSGGGTITGFGSHGGGAVYLTVLQHASLLGKINVDSQDTGNSAHGSGGSIYLQADSLAGGATTEISASCGLDGWANRGRGAGGRIAIILTGTGADFGDFSDATIQAITRNLAGAKGGAGTIYLQEGDQASGEGVLIVDNGGVTGTFSGSGIGLDYDALASVTVENGGRLRIGTGDTINLSTVDLTLGATLHIADASGVVVNDPWVVENYTIFLADAPDIEELVIDGNRTLHLQTPLVLSSLRVKDGAALRTYNQPISVSGNAEVESGGQIDANGTGYLQLAGPGYHEPRDGGSYGGMGGEANAGVNGIVGPTYGSILEPLARGSGGGRGTTAGGILQMEVTGTLTLNGAIRSRSLDSPSTEASGSGGSVNIRVGQLIGTNASALIDARSGSHAHHGGGGGGGRVAVRLLGPQVDFSGFAGTIDARAASGTGSGAGGTVYLQTASDEEGGGTVSINFHNVATAFWTQLPPPFAGNGTYPAATYAFDDDLSRALFEARNQARVRLTDDLTIYSLDLDADSSLELDGNTLTVRLLTIDGNAIDNGTYDASDFTQVTDLQGTGEIVVFNPPKGTFIVIQ